MVETEMIIMNQVITRKEARELGLAHYYTGKACKRGHVSERYTTGGCIVCAKERNNQWYSDPVNKEKQKEYDRKRHEELYQDPEWVKKKRERDRERYQDPVIKAKARAYYEDHKHNLLFIINQKYSQLVKRSEENDLGPPATYEEYLDKFYSCFDNEEPCCMIDHMPFVYGEGRNPRSISIDRIDNSRGYQKENIQFITDYANNCKNEGTNESLLNNPKYIAFVEKSRIRW